MSNPTMPAGQLHLLLWHFFTPEPYPCPLGLSHKGFVAELLRLDLMKDESSSVGLLPGRYDLIDRGRVYVEGLLQTPLPVQRWVAA